MAIRKKKIIDTTLNDVTTTIAGTFDFNGVTPKRITLLVQITKTSTPTSVTLTVKTSPDGGITLIAYDKLQVDAGTDGPVSSVAYTVTADDTISLAIEDVVEYLYVLLTGSGTGASATFACKVWVVAEY